MTPAQKQAQKTIALAKKLAEKWRANRREPHDGIGGCRGPERPAGGVIPPPAGTSTTSEQKG